MIPSGFLDPPMIMFVWSWQSSTYMAYWFLQSYRYAACCTLQITYTIQCSLRSRKYAAYCTLYMAYCFLQSHRYAACCSLILRDLFEYSRTVNFEYVFEWRETSQGRGCLALSNSASQQRKT